MERQDDLKMWLNLVKGAGLLLGGVLAACLVGQVYASWRWTQLNQGLDFEDDGPSSGGLYDEDAFLSYVLDDDESGMDMAQEVPPLFLAECLDPSAVGEVRAMREGDVVGIVSSLDRDDLFNLCCDSLGSLGWVQVSADSSGHASYVKARGTYRWLFLDVTRVSDSSTAVFTLREAS